MIEIIIVVGMVLGGLIWHLRATFKSIEEELKHY